MSQYGIRVKNEYGNLIISDEIPGIHLLEGNIKPYRTWRENSSLNFPSYDGTNDALGGNAYFQFKTRAYSNTPPIVFVKPHVDKYNEFYSVDNLRLKNGYWIFEIMASGTDTIYHAPTAYVFVSGRDLPPSDEKYGMIVRDENGKITFDSRYRALGIVGNATSRPYDIPPKSGDSNARNTEYEDEGICRWPAEETCGLISCHCYYPWNYNTLDWNYKCDTSYNREYFDNSNNIPTTELMFTAPSTAKAVYQRIMNGYKNSDGQEHWSTAHWVVYYKQGIRVGYNYIDNGWITSSSYYAFWSAYEDAWWGLEDGGSDYYGYIPAFLSTVGSQRNTYMVADSRWYR